MKLDKHFFLASNFAHAKVQNIKNHIFHIFKYYTEADLKIYYAESDMIKFCNLHFIQLYSMSSLAFYSKETTSFGRGQRTKVMPVFLVKNGETRFSKVTIL